MVIGIGVFVVVTDIATPSTVGQPHTHHFIPTWGAACGSCYLACSWDCPPVGKYRMNDCTRSDKGGMVEKLQAGRWGGKRGAVVTPLLP